MANYEDLKYSGLTGSVTLSSAVEQTVGTMDSVVSGSVAYTAANDVVAGDAVVMNSSGEIEHITVESAGSLTGALDDGLSSSVTHGNQGSVSIDPNDSNKFIVAHTNNIRIGTIDPTSGAVTLSASTSFDGRNTELAVVRYVPGDSTRAVVVYRDGTKVNNTYYGRMRVITISGTTCTLGSETTFDTGAWHSTFEFDPFDSNRFMIVHTTYTARVITATVCTVSGTSISTGVDTIIHADDGVWVGYPNIAWNTDVQGKVLLSHLRYDTIAQELISLSVSGTTITLDGISFSLPNGVAAPVAIYHHSGDDYVIKYRWSGAATDAGIAVATVAATITIGTFVGVSRTVIVKIGGGYAIVGELNDMINVNAVDIAGSVVTIGSNITTSNVSSYNGSPYSVDGNVDKIVYLFPYTGGTNAAIVGQITPAMSASSVDNFGIGDTVFGIASATVASGATVDVVINGGTYDGLTGLIPGKKYYVQSDGAISQVSLAPAVILGRAMSTTAIKINI
jgi:hypothetical protein